MWSGATGRVESAARRTYQTTYSADEPPTVAITRAIAAIEGVDATELPVLFGTVDPEELDTILGVPSTNHGGEPTVIMFSTLGYRVQASDDGRISILATADTE